MKIENFSKCLAHHILVIFIILAFFHSYASASVSYFPTSEWQISTPEAQGMHSKPILEMMTAIKKKGYTIQNVSIIRNGYLVLDAYIYPFKDGQKHGTYSVTKSVISALIGIAIDKGYIKNVNQTITELFPNKKIANLDELKRSLTLKDLLIMASGFDCNDASANRWAGTIAMTKSSDWTQYTLNLPMAQTPGEYFHYCNGVSHLLSAIIQESSGMKTVEFAKKYLFDPLGIEDVDWAESPEGTSNGFSGLRLKPKDMAKIGLLYLNQGKWENKQIISVEWISVSTRPYIDGRWNGEDYGYQWWINPAGYYSAVGMYGQAIYVIPDKNLVAVFTSHITGKDMYISGTLLKEYIIPAIASSGPLPPDPENNAQLDNFLAGTAKAPTQGIIWLSEKQGIAKDGVFKRKASPSFQFTYPLGSTKAELGLPSQIMRMKTPEGIVFAATIMDIPEGVKLEDFGPVYIVKWFRIYRYGSNLKVTSNEEITLKDGTQAYQTNFTWVWNNTDAMTTFQVSAYKDGKCIFLSTHPWQNPAKYEPIVQSLTFE
ncbi:MAG: serine hydrolase [Desulfobacteraceae bacterium]|jgi:CubicO group peptidase (beta-lactamase class C family)|nr:serine hydrolase [Desulfobacteraceae bacterium]